MIVSGTPLLSSLYNVFKSLSRGTSEKSEKTRLPYHPCSGNICDTTLLQERISIITNIRGCTGRNFYEMYNIGGPVGKCTRDSAYCLILCTKGNGAEQGILAEKCIKRRFGFINRQNQ